MLYSDHRSAFPQYILQLTGQQWAIQAGNTEAINIVNDFANAMSLSLVNQATDTKVPEEATWSNLVVFINPAGKRLTVNIHQSKPHICVLPSPDDNELYALAMSHIGLSILPVELERGGVLVHGALAEVPAHYGGGGILLAGPGTVGKTTASNRLPPPWKSLSDDASLISPGDDGQYWVHPWPTWSRFNDLPDGTPGSGGIWDTQYRLPLRAVFFLSQAEEDRISPITPTSATSCLMETIQHVSKLLTRQLPLVDAQPIHEKELLNASEIMRVTPSYRFDISRSRPFWKKIEELFRTTPPTIPHQPKRTIPLTSSLTTKSQFSQKPLFRDDTIIVNYFGNSMSPTLNHPDLLIVSSYKGQTLNVGDVIYYQPPAIEPKTVHRIIASIPEGFVTRGDGNNANDAYILNRNDIIGIVTAARSYNKHRVVAGGKKGLLIAYRCRFAKWLHHQLSFLLGGTYRRLVSSGFFYNRLPAWLKPQIFEFKRQFLPPILKLIIKGYVIGQFNPQQKNWQLNRLWKLLIDTSTLPIARDLSFFFISYQDLDRHILNHSSPPHVPYK